MTTFLALLLKLQFNLTATGSLFFMMAFQRIDGEFENEGFELQLEAQELELQEAVPADEVQPAKPEEKADE